MDIFINKLIDKNEMQLFLNSIGENLAVLIFSEKDWELVDNNQNSIEYIINKNINGQFKSGFCMHYEQNIIEKQIDYLSKEIAKYFLCNAVSTSNCGSSKNLEKYNSIMYSNNKTYIIDDSKIDETGEIEIIKEISPTTGST